MMTRFCSPSNTMVNNQCVKSLAGAWTLSPERAPVKSGRRPTSEQGVWRAQAIISPNPRRMPCLCVCGLLRGAASYRTF